MHTKYYFKNVYGKDHLTYINKKITLKWILNKLDVRI
jgi:hypothetical protein